MRLSRKIRVCGGENARDVLGGRSKEGTGQRWPPGLESRWQVKAWEFDSSAFRASVAEWFSSVLLSRRRRFDSYRGYVVKVTF